MDIYKCVSGCMFLMCSEIFEVLIGMGYCCVFDVDGILIDLCENMVFVELFYVLMMFVDNELDDFDDDGDSDE